MVLAGSDCLHVISDCFDSFFEICMLFESAPPENLQSWVKYYENLKVLEKNFGRPNSMRCGEGHTWLSFFTLGYVRAFFGLYWRLHDKTQGMTKGFRDMIWHDETPAIRGNTFLSSLKSSKSSKSPLFETLIIQLWVPSRHLGSLRVANWVSFDFNVSYSSLRCVYHKGKTFVVYHKVTVFFACGFSLGKGQGIQL